MVQRSWEDANGKANVICCRWIKRFNFQNCIHHIHSIEWWLNNIRQLLCAVCMHRCCYHMWNVSYVLTWFLLKKNTHTPFFLHFSPDMPHSKFHFLLLIPAAPLPLSFRVKSHTFIKRKEKMNTYHGKRFHTPYEQVNMFFFKQFHCDSTSQPIFEHIYWFKVSWNAWDKGQSFLSHRRYDNKHWFK